VDVKGTVCVEEGSKEIGVGYLGEDRGLQCQNPLGISISEAIT
jgi:hypothetical protein